MKRRRFFNMYLTTTISVTLVLFLLGLETSILLSARHLVQQVKENVALTVVLNDNTDSLSLVRMNNVLSVAPFVREFTYISEQQALEEHVRNLGDDPSKFLGFNPLQASYEVRLNADYAQSDSIALIKTKLTAFPFVNRIIYQEEVVNILDSNVNNISLILLGVGVVLLFVALALIINTVRLHVYSKRFLINTMKLVGATPWVIKSPVVRRNALMGFIAACLALLVLVGTFYYTQYQLNIMLIIVNLQNLIIISAIVILAGVLITTLASVFAVNRYIRMKTDDLYYV